MRNLIVTRKKSFVGSLAKMKVYIEDPDSGDLAINNVPCRKLGTLKNGEKQTFAIEDGAAKVYVIADTLSKDYCNEFYELPEGQEDVELTGKNCYNPAAGNPFRFDNNPSAGAAQNRKRGTKVGLIVLVVALVVGAVIGGIIGIGAGVIKALNSMSEPKSFTEGGMTITLTNAFQKMDYEGFAAVFGSTDVVVLAEKESFAADAALGSMSRETYANLFIQNNNLTGSEVWQEEGLTWFQYKGTNPDSKATYRYSVYVFKTEDAFWVVQIAVLDKDADKYAAQIMDWAKTITFAK